MTTTPPVIDNNDGPPENLDPIPRNRYGAPRAPHPYTGKTVTWQRPSGLAKKCLADTYHLDLWVQRTIAKGAGLSPDLGALAAHLDISEDKAQLDDLAARMGKAGGAGGARPWSAAEADALNTLRKTRSSFTRVVLSARPSARWKMCS